MHSKLHHFHSGNCKICWGGAHVPSAGGERDTPFCTHPPPLGLTSPWPLTPLYKILDTPLFGGSCLDNVASISIWYEGVNIIYPTVLLYAGQADQYLEVRLKVKVICQEWSTLRQYEQLMLCKYMNIQWQTSATRGPRHKAYFGWITDTSDPRHFGPWTLRH